MFACAQTLSSNKLGLKKEQFSSVDHFCELKKKGGNEFRLVALIVLYVRHAERGKESSVEESVFETHTSAYRKS